MRNGITTGSCAAAAAKAAVILLAEGIKLQTAEILTPSGQILKININKHEIGESFAVAAVIKDSGDDPDITNGIEIFARAEWNNSQEINIVGGRGIGRVTKKGLKVPTGESAINPIPMQMIRESIEEIAEGRGINIEIYVPNGEEIAKKTFNPKLGIEGGISILGTTGIVKPMSEEAYKESLAIDISVAKKEYGFNSVVIVPGNYGRDFAITKLGVDEKKIIVMSNFVGYIIDKCVEEKIEKVIITGNIGKLIKVAGGIFQTHSRESDAKLEIMAANAFLCGEKQENILKILRSNTVEESIDYIENIELFNLLAEKISAKASERSYGKIEFGTIIFSGKDREIARCKAADHILKEVLNA